MNTQAVVLIPVYKQKLDVFEKVSLFQAVRVFKNYDIKLIMPVSLEFPCIIEDRELIIERFEDCFFRDRATYSKLLLSEFFYERFQAYEYMLIYQLDAFVFSDRLKEFCEMGFDYIGAPIAEGDWKKYHVGNGGLSLRKISSTLELVSHKNEVMQDNPLRELFLIGEDNFFAYCGVESRYEYRVPSVRLAAQFSAQNDVGHGLRDIPKRGLPFGTHHWPTMNYQIWKPIIERFGYFLPAIDDVEYRDYLKEDQRERLYNLIGHLLRVTTDDEKCKLGQALGLNLNLPYIIWGAGYQGKRCAKTMKGLSNYIVAFYDKNASVGQEIHGIPVLKPNEERIRAKREIVVIAALYYEKEIEAQLCGLGLEKEKDYFSYFDLYQKLEQYFLRILPQIPGITSSIDISRIINVPLC